ncbi:MULTISPECIES: TetR/AcrR family transcriptional regulator [unclassified Streptomyces]|uniref:TetR/AcrR family transcriptional regulator n=1 Tax=unclassified Streptomyces TaxID=2593676 RepID=UPI002E144A36|nr:TetR/AcrR family transcriptional regulator [Streptomyces sp. NBC_01186]WSS39504.1 TetR/AcrR family transcriptional regulator [Streptomyces sp. NBC_01187]
MDRKNERIAGERGATRATGARAAGRRADGGATRGGGATGGGGPTRGGGASRRRGAELENAILDASWNVLVEHGYLGFTYEAVAARAGTSRPVLYRRWPQHEDLLLATLTKFWQPITVPDTGSLRDDAISFLRNVHAGRAHMITLMSVQLVDYFRDTGTSFSELREALLTPGRATAFETIVARAVQRGELPDMPRSSRVVDLPFDLLRHDMLLTMRAVSDESIVEIVDEVWLPLLGVPGDLSASSAPAPPA